MKNVTLKEMESLGNETERTQKRTRTSDEVMKNEHAGRNGTKE